MSTNEVSPISWMHRECLAWLEWLRRTILALGFVCLALFMLQQWYGQSVSILIPEVYRPAFEVPHTHHK